MSVIQNLIQKLNLLAQKNDSSAIHVDAMLDLTKQIYVALQTSSAETNADGIKPLTNNFVQEAIVNNAFQTLQQSNTEMDSAAEINAEMEDFFNDGITINDDVVTSAVLNTETDMNQDDQIEEIKTIPEFLNPSIQSPINQSIGNDGISIELPTQNIVQKITTHIPSKEQETTPPVIIPSLHSSNSELLEEAVAIEKHGNVEDATLSDGIGFKSPTVPNQKDFRTQIGFNDRYLFLNELFNNNKELFDTSIAKINNTNNYQTAKEWIDNELADNLKWSADDSTVTSFYMLVEKYFTTT